ncbi:MAG: STAS domain-containing protein [Fibrobacter sp.]|jgi:anti-anti-sigma factor|nr:STAS domain-containing protein [Fibrobacter sp.]
MLRKRETQRQREEENFMVDGESMTLEVTLKKTDENPVLELVGRIVDADVKKFQRKIEQLYKKKHKQIVVDVSCASFLDSHGLGTIVYYHTLMQKEKRELIILNANPDANSYLNRLFELTNLDKVLNIVTHL